MKLFEKLIKRKESPKDSKHLRLRVESCVSTILELNTRLGAGRIKPEIVEQFEKLKGFLDYVSDHSADEIDIEQIEEATNQLLAEIAESTDKKLAHFPGDGMPH